MPELTENEIESIRETHDTVIRVATVLLGTNGDNGLVGDVKRIGESHFKLKRNFWILVSFLAGSGVLGGSLWAIFAGG